MKGGGRRIENFALIIGAMKAGTTSLYEHLIAHPEIARCRRKEPNFFGSKLWSEGSEAYAGLWPHFDPVRHAWALEGSSHYTKHPQHPRAAERIATFDGRFKLLYIVRDPIDRIESHFAHNIAHGRIGAGNYRSRLQHALNVSRYAMQLDRFQKALGDQDILVLDFDALRENPSALLRRCVDFLGIDSGFTFPPRPPSNRRRAAHGAAGFRLGAEERAEVRAALAEDMQRFGAEWGFDVAKWGFGRGGELSEPRAGPAPDLRAGALPPATPPG